MDVGLMWQLAARRLALLVPTLLGVATLTFAVLHFVPGDPVDVLLGESATPADREALRRDLGLDRPLAAQYVGYLVGLTRGDLGHSLAFRAPVASVVASRYPATLELAGAALGAALLVALPLGIVGALRPRSWLDRTARIASLVGVCIPTLCLGPGLILLFSMQLGWLPVSGRGGIAHLVLPAATLGLGMAGVLVRQTRTSVLAAIHEDYVRTARAKGLPEWRVVLSHVLRNALIPIVTVSGLQAGSLLAGAVITETIFAWPGVGRLAVQAIGARDFSLVQGCVLAMGITYVLVNSLTDLLYRAIDPRLRDERP
jgi:peptide/nickel transport system permease protein